MSLAGRRKCNEIEKDAGSNKNNELKKGETLWPLNKKNLTTTTLLQEMDPFAFVVVFDCLVKQKKCQPLKAFQADRQLELKHKRGT